MHIHKRHSLTQNFLVEFDGFSMLSQEHWVHVTYVVLTTKPEFSENLAQFLGHFTLQSKPFLIKEFTPEFQLLLQIAIDNEINRIVEAKEYSVYTGIPKIYKSIA